MASVQSSLTGAHPRSRGENAAEETAVDIHLGSSPLTRGKRRVGSRWDHANRLIPAHAGKTAYLGDGLDDGPAHPRSRGENDASQVTQTTGPGSSPLTRGKL